MQHENSFSVSRFKNRNGVFSFRVDGYLNGNRIRRNFKTREEAAAEQAALTIKALQLASNLRSVSTSLTEDQVREAEVAFRRIAERGRPLSFYVDFTLTNYREEDQKQTSAFQWPRIHRDNGAANRDGALSEAEALRIVRPFLLETGVVSRKFSGIV